MMMELDSRGIKDLAVCSDAKNIYQKKISILRDKKGESYLQNQL